MSQSGRWTELGLEGYSDSTALPTRLFRSTASGLLVCFADVPGPLINVFTTLRTETTDSRGLPHSLEHLIFLGSRSLPYKGVLDELSSFAFADGTNAWTAQDHTAYELNLGSETGLHVILPLYLDHIFHPLLEDPHFLTEVYALDGDNNDAGVVFCEMQGVERKASTCSECAMQKVLFPGKNGYNVETGGLMEALRSPEMNMDAIRDYHKRYYRPDNCIIFVCASQLDAKPVLASLDEMDSKLALLADPKLERPFSQKLDSLIPTEKTIHYPSESEDFGRVAFGFRVGPIKELVEVSTALAVLADYLSDGVASPLYQALVDLDQPFCRSVSFSFDHYAELAFSIRLRGCPVERIDQARTKVIEVLRELVEQNRFDADRMKTILNTTLQNEYSEMETDPAQTLQDNLGVAFLYFDVQKDFRNIMWGERERLRQLLKDRVSDSSFWIDLVRKYIVDAPRVVVTALPSKELHAKNAAEDEERAAQRRAQLGEEGIKKAGEAFDAAVAASETPCPEDLMQSYRDRMQGSIDSSRLHCLETFRLAGMRSFGNGPSPWFKAHMHLLNALPFHAFQADHYSNTQFVDLMVSFDFDGIVSPKKMKYFELFCELLFSVPLVDIPDHTKVESERRRDLLEEAVSVGLQGGKYFVPGAWPTVFSMFCRARSYDKAVQWMRRSFYDSQFLDIERIHVALNALKSYLDDAKRSVSVQRSNAISKLLLDPESVSNALSYKKQRLFVKKFSKVLKTDPAKAQRKLSQFVKTLRSCKPMVHVVADFRQILDPISPWTSWFNEAGALSSKVVQDPSLPPPTSAFRRRDAFSSRQELLMQLPIDDSYAHVYWPGPSFEKGKDDIPAALMFCAWMSMMESLFWKAIRGQGLAYGVSIHIDTESGWFYLSISRANAPADLHQSIVSAIEILDNLDEHVDEKALAYGRSIATYNVLSGLTTHQMVAENRFKSLMRGYSAEWLLEQFDRVTIQDLRKVWKRYLRNKSKKAVFAVTLPKGETFEFDTLQ